jgi:tetratricopeptide (TPR) repeat protein
MQSSISSYQEFAKEYTSAFEALYAIARAYYCQGRLAEAQHLLRMSLDLAEAPEVRPQLRLKLLLLYAQILILELFLSNLESSLVFSTISDAKQLAEAIHDQKGLADALSLLGQAHYFVKVVISLNTGVPLDSSQAEGKFDEAQNYQQQALELREALQDTRGASESHFFIGNVCQRWQQYDLAKQHFIQALQIAGQYGHIYEKTEPSRHLAFLAFTEGDLDQALNYALQALAFREEARFKPYLPLDHLLLSDIYLKRKDPAKALPHTQQALALAEEMGFKKLLVLSLIGLGDVQVALKEEAPACTSYEKALGLAQEVQSAMYIARANQRLQSLTNQ